jgi:hypothetical protein
MLRCYWCQTPMMRGSLAARTREGHIMHAYCYYQNSVRHHAPTKPLQIRPPLQRQPYHYPDYITRNNRRQTHVSADNAAGSNFPPTSPTFPSVTLPSPPPPSLVTFDSMSTSSASTELSSTGTEKYVPEQDLEGGEVTPFPLTFAVTPFSLKGGQHQDDSDSFVSSVTLDVFE